MRLTIHGGMPKTGTTALQLRLANSAHVLQAHGIDYPERFRNAEGIAHHKLGEGLSGSDAACHMISRSFLGYLRNNPNPNVLVSSEAITNALTTRLALRTMQFLEHANSFRTVRLVLVLREVHSFMESMYLHASKVGETRLAINEYLKLRKNWSRAFFGVLAAIRAAGVVKSLRLTKFAPTAGFDDAVLAELMIPPHVRSLLNPPRRENEKLSWKAQTTLLHLPELESVLEIELPRQELLKSLQNSEIVFRNDITSYSILTEGQQLRLRDGAFAAASEVGLSEYITFFADTAVAPAARVRLDIGVLDEHDVTQLRQWAEHARSVGRRRGSSL